MILDSVTEADVDWASWIVVVNAQWKEIRSRSRLVEGSTDQSNKKVQTVTKAAGKAE